jgi:hypothetical protein
MASPPAALVAFLMIAAVASVVFAEDPNNPGPALVAGSVPGPDAALVAESSSTVTISVEYTNPFDQLTSSQAYSSVNMWATSGQITQPQSITIAALPANLSLTQGQAVNVTYTVTIGPYSKGFYDITLYQICGPLPLAVDYPSSAVTPADFPRFNGIRSCPAQFLNVVITGYSGASLVGI